MRPSSSVGAVRPIGHNSDSSLARFDGGAHYYGDLGLVEGEVAGGVLVASFHLGLEDYEHYRSSSSSEDLFASDDESGSAAEQL